jgi:opacity protein-like surface antigen
MNKKLKSVILSGAALTLWGGSALAADIAPPASDWTGFYAGVGGGGSFNFSDTDASGGAYIYGEGLVREGGHSIDETGFFYTDVDCPQDTTCRVEQGNVTNIGDGMFTRIIHQGDDCGLADVA